MSVWGEIAQMGAVKAPVRLRRGESVSYVERPLRGDRWEYDPRFAQWGRPFVLNARPSQQMTLGQRIVARLGELHDRAQWRQGRGPKPANMAPDQPLYPVGSYGSARLQRATKAYDRGGYRHGKNPDKAGLRGKLHVDSMDRRYQTYMVPERNAQVTADARFAPFTDPHEAVITRGSFRPWRDTAGARLAKEEGFFLDQPAPPSRRLQLPRTPESVRLVPGPQSLAVPARIPVRQALQQAKPTESVLARVAAFLRRAGPFKTGMPGGDRGRVRTRGGQSARFAGGDLAIFRTAGDASADPGMTRKPFAVQDIRSARALVPLYRQGIANWVEGRAPAEFAARMNTNWRDDTDQPLVRIPTRGERARYRQRLDPVMRSNTGALLARPVYARVGQL